MHHLNTKFIIFNAEFIILNANMDTSFSAFAFAFVHSLSALVRSLSSSFCHF